MYIQNKKGVTMKHVILGTFDYLLDCWRDFWFSICQWLYEHTYNYRNAGGYYIKEGGLDHYIYNRQVSEELKKQRRMEER